MNAVIKMLLGVCAIFLIGALSIPFDILPGSAASAERSLSHKLSQSLFDHDFPWVQITFDGQKAIVAGEAPSQEERDAALNLVRSAIWNGGMVVGGVTAVDSADLKVVEGPPLADPFIWIAEHQGGSLVFSGYVPSQRARDEIFKLARTRFSNAEISGELDIARGGPPETDWLAAAVISLRALARLEEGAIEANGATFTLNGKAINQNRAVSLQQLMAKLPENIKGLSNIQVHPSVPIEQTIIAAKETDAVNNEQTQAPGEAPADDNAPATPVLSQREITDNCRRRLKEIIDGRRIGFASARSNLDRSSRQQLTELAQTLGECPQFRIEIVGHTDSSGSDRRNRRLSQSRADAVLAHLNAAGVSSDRLDALGVGSTKPLTSNATPQGRERNRRIDINLIFDPQ